MKALAIFLSSILSLLISFAAHAEVVDRVLAVVNDQIVTQSDMDAFQKRLKSKGLVDEALLNFYDIKKINSSSADRMAYLVDERLIDSEVVRQGVVSPIEKVEGEIRNILNNTRTTRESLKSSLRARGITYAEYQDFIKTSLQRQNLLQKEISSKIKISDDDIASAYIQKAKDSKALVFEYELAHILFLPKPDQKDAVLKKAASIKDQLSQGANFEALAAQYSEDPEFSQGGIFGTVKVGEILPQMEKALSGLRPGDTTEVVQMADGLHIFKVLKRSLVPSPEFNRARAAIADSLFAESFRRQYFIWIEGLRTSSYVKINK